MRRQIASKIFTNAAQKRGATMTSGDDTRGESRETAEDRVPNQKFRLRLFRGDVDGKPDYHLQVHRDAEHDAKDDEYEEESERVLVDEFDITISDTDEECHAAIAVKALQHVGDGMQFLLEMLMRGAFDYAYELGKKDGLKESRQGMPEFKIPYVVFQYKGNAAQELRIDVDGRVDGGMRDSVDFRLHLMHLLKSLEYDVGSAIPHVNLFPQPRPHFLFRSGVLIPVPSE